MELKCCGLAVWAASVIIIISTVTLSIDSAAGATDEGYSSSSSSSSNSYNGFSSSRLGEGGGVDHEDLTNPNIYDGEFIPVCS